MPAGASAAAAHQSSAMTRGRGMLGPFDGAAILAGCLLLAVLSVARQAARPWVDGLPWIAIPMSVLVYVMPGAVAGAIAPSAWRWSIVMLAIFAGAFLTWQMGGFDPPAWSSPLLYKVFLLLASLGAAGCAVGMLLGSGLRRRRLRSAPPPERS